MQNLGRKIEIFIIVVIIAVVGIIYAFKKPVSAPSSNTDQNQNQQQTPNTGTSINPGTGGVEPPTQQVPTTTIEYNGQDGKNALDLLKSSHNVEAKQYSFGSFVNSIDGIAPDANHFWAFYINDQFSQVAADKYITKSSDKLKWQMDAVVDTKK